MGTMSLAQLGRLLRLAFGQDSPPSQFLPPAIGVPAADSLMRDAYPDDESLPPQAMGAYLAWLVGVDDILSEHPPKKPEALIQAADAEINAKGCCTRLLRRSPTVLPRLIRLLRNETYTTAELAQHIEQDIVLAAEVMRMARSALYAHLGGATLDLRQAAGVLGSSGVEQVMARVLLWPLYRSDSSALQACSAARLWEESERCATACVLIARTKGIDTFDAYVAGLLQNAGWSALLRVFELHRVEAALHPVTLSHERWQLALLQRRDQLLSRLIPAWQLSAGLTATARALDPETSAPATPLGEVVRAAQAQIMRKRLRELVWEPSTEVITW